MFQIPQKVCPEAAFSFISSRHAEADEMKLMLNFASCDVNRPNNLEDSFYLRFVEDILHSGQSIVFNDRLYTPRYSRWYRPTQSKKIRKSFLVVNCCSLKFNSEGSIIAYPAKTDLDIFSRAPLSSGSRHEGPSYQFPSSIGVLNFYRAHGELIVNEIQGSVKYSAMSENSELKKLMLDKAYGAWTSALISELFMTAEYGKITSIQINPRIKCKPQVLECLFKIAADFGWSKRSDHYPFILIKSKATHSIALKPEPNK